MSNSHRGEDGRPIVLFSSLVNSTFTEVRTQYPSIQRISLTSCSKASTRPPLLELSSYGHMYACMILCVHEADSPLPQRGADQEAAKAVRQDRRSGGGTHPACH